MHGFREEVGTGTVGQKEHSSGRMGSLHTGVVCEGCKRKGWGADAAVGAKGAHVTASNILALLTQSACWPPVVAGQALAASPVHGCP